MAISSALAVPVGRTLDEVRSLPCQLGRFTLFDHVGRGGMADIYLARELRPDGPRLVVLKEVLASLAQREHFSEMLVAEALLAQQLDHACIARVEQLGGHDGVPFIAMEYVEGLDLNELLRACSRRGLALPLGLRLAVVLQVLAALDHAHTAVGRDGEVLGVVHRDVSPSNVLLSFEGKVKLCDFGIALAARVADEPGGVVGKAGYMSPEHARGSQVDGRSDVFAAGILLWELLAGRRMYRERDAQARLALAARGVAPELPRLSLPDEARLVAIVERALREDPEQRYQTAAAMREALLGYATDNDYLLGAEQLGQWLRSHFEDERITTRRARQRALQALDRGPAVVLTPVASLGDLAPVRESGTRLIAAKRAPLRQLNGGASSQPEAELELDEALSPSMPLVIPPLPVPSFEALPAAPQRPQQAAGEKASPSLPHYAITRTDLRRTASHRRIALTATASHRRVRVPPPRSLRTVARFALRCLWLSLALMAMLACLGAV